MDETDVSVVGVGVDFGTSNCVIGLLRANGSVIFAKFVDRGATFHDFANTVMPESW